jgi:transcription-repair coupling factor (superfamily II helicase)
VQFVAKNQIAWRVRPDNKVVVKGEWETPEQRLAAAEKVLSELARLAA